MYQICAFQCVHMLTETLQETMQVTFFLKLYFHYYIYRNMYFKLIHCYAKQHSSSGSCDLCMQAK